MESVTQKSFMEKIYGSMLKREKNKKLKSHLRFINSMCEIQHTYIEKWFFDYDETKMFGRIATLVITLTTLFLQ